MLQLSKLLQSPIPGGNVIVHNKERVEKIDVKDNKLMAEEK